MSCTYYNHFIPGNACVFNYTVKEINFNSRVLNIIELFVTAWKQIITK